MFSLRDFIKKGLIDAIGKMADYQVILNATGWYEKSVLTQEDLAEIDAKITENNAVKEIPIEKIPTESSTVSEEKDRR